MALAADAARFARAFARRAVGAGDPGAELLAAAVAERRARSAEILDACHFALERLLRAADRAGLRLAAQIGVTPWQVASPRELGVSVRDASARRSASPGIPARLSVLARASTFRWPTTACARSRRRRALVVDNDAVGLAPGYLPGLGERDERLAAFSPAVGLPRVVVGPADASDAEVAAALSSGPAAPGGART